MHKLLLKRRPKIDRRETLRIPQRSPRVKRAILAALLGAALGYVGLTYNGLERSFITQFSITPELLLCLLMIPCVYFSQIWPVLGTFPLVALTLYHLWLLLSSFDNLDPHSVVFVGMLACITGILYMYMFTRKLEYMIFSRAARFYIVLLCVGVFVNVGPYYSFSVVQDVASIPPSILAWMRMPIKPARYHTDAIMFIGKAMAAMCVLRATEHWAHALTRDWNEAYFGDPGLRGLRHLSLDWIAPLRKY
ncbi:MAG: hypothetical protein FWF10_06445 [Clostridiales bacterium]|nr:hypothetical protein [Clostridiales bacterium]